MTSSRFFLCHSESTVKTDNLNYKNSFIYNNEPFTFTYPEKYEIKYVLYRRRCCVAMWYEDLEYYISCTMKNFMMLEFSFEEQIDYSFLRLEVTEFLLRFRTFLLRRPINMGNRPKILNDYNVLMKKLRWKLSGLPYQDIIATKEKDNGHPYYRLHLMLDIYWVMKITVEHTLDVNRNKNIDIFNRNVTHILCEFITIANMLFTQNDTHKNLRELSPYPCTCFKEFLLLLQLYVETLVLEDFCLDFWFYYNQAIKEVFSKSNTENSGIIQLWILYHVSFIQGYDKQGIYVADRPDGRSRIVPNYFALLQCMENIISTNDSEEKMMPCLNLISIICINLWQNIPPEVYQLIGKFFHRLGLSDQLTTDSATNNKLLEKYSSMDD